MIETGAQSVAIDELMSLPYVANVATELGAGFCGNIRTTDALMFQFISPREDAIACMAAGCGRPGYVLGCGSPIPYDVDPKNVEMVVEAKEWFDKKYRKKYPHYDPFVDTEYPAVEEKIPNSLLSK
jgi:uroporphyrinogen-III decarboxylase